MSSLESALEDERLSVVKLLESIDKRSHSRHRASQSPAPRPLLLNERSSSGRSSFSASASASGSRKNSSSMILSPSQNTTSLLLDDVPKNRPQLPNGRANSSSSVPTTDLGNSLKPTKSSPAATQVSNHIDPSISGNSSYNSAGGLRPTKSSQSQDRSTSSRIHFRAEDEASGGFRNARGTSLSNHGSRSQSRSNMLSPTRSTDLSPQTSRSRSNSRPRKSDMNFKGAYRRLSSNQLKKAQGALGDLYRSPSVDGKKLEDGVESSSDEDEETGTSSDDTDTDEDSIDEDSDSDLEGLNTRITKASVGTRTLMAAMEEERKSIESSKFRVKSLLDAPAPPGTVPPPSMAEYAAYKRRIIHPSTAFDNITDAPYPSDSEEVVDAERAAQLPFNISTVESVPGSKRLIRTLSRGESNAAITDPTMPRPKTYVLGTDLSPEATHALEWTIGTVLRDGNVLYVACAYEDDDQSGPSSSSAVSDKQEEDRMDAMKQLTHTIERLLKRTRLQVHVIIEVVHCKSPKHLIMSVIDHVKPTMVIIGSRGRSALKGVLLGSFSNYIVERSTVPAMVARRKLQKTKHKDLDVRLVNNVRGGLSAAKVD